MSRSPFSQQGGKCYTVLEVEILLTYRFCETVIHIGNKGYKLLLRGSFVLGSLVKLWSI